MSRLFLAASALAIATAGTAAAQVPDARRTQPQPAPAPEGEIVITAPYLQSEEDVLQGTSVVTGAELARELRPTIGETLARQPGVSATSFGPSASRPVLRGLQGERVRVLTDGIGAIDVSNTSVDHAVVIDPLLAERVEVLRGPSALLFGSSAIGGVVNVIDSRIPREVPEGGYRIRATGGYGSAANERTVGAAADVALGKFVINANGSYMKSGDLRIGGFALSPRARAEALSQVGLPQDDDHGHDHDHDHDHDHGDDDHHHHEPVDFAANAALRDRLPNTAARTWTAGAGVSIVTDTGHLGIAYSRYDSFYGVPVRYATLVGQEQHAPQLDIKQDRFDLRGEVETGGGFLDRIRLRAGHATYRHFEVEDGAIGTSFFSNGLEGRLELIQANHGGWRGASGVQYFDRQFDVVGDEAFLPRNETQQIGLFTLQQVDLGRFRAEGGLRYEWSDLTARPVGGTRYFSGTRDFRALSASLGASVEVTDGVRVGINASHTERAPSAEELFANGEHAGTQAYELGNPNFVKERSRGLEATLHAHSGPLSFDASAYYNRFRNFIYEAERDEDVCEAAAGDHVDVPCFQHHQAGATLYGFEADLSLRLGQVGGYAINLDGIADYTRATVRGGGPVPRIPALRLLGGLEAQGASLTARAEVEHVFDQDRVATFETPTSGYTMVNASVSWRPFGDDRTTLLLSANNLFDVTARRHASFLKDFAPLAGRDLRATLRFGF
ncbi:TonB-dependent receptor [Sphingomonas sp.]|uniref:TonB-dependent receptor n=1 Tax=Sphingomonas sp. TaxID=28214 RepID=UPI002DD63E84|nr:TonB-dependent receptor [Sphingomonas sp.]